jgi:LysM repeat protein
MGQAKKALFFNFQPLKPVLGVLTILSFIFMPFAADASFFSSVLGTGTAQASTGGNSSNSQNLAILQASVSPNRGNTAGTDISIENNSALQPEVGPLGTASDVKSDYISDQIINYVVRKGDTIAGVAKMFGISKNTIIWANNLKSTALSEGQNLLILPVSGVQYIVKKGDTLKKIANKFKADIADVGSFNGLTPESLLAVGDEIIIPDGEISQSESGPKTSSSNPEIYSDAGPAVDGYYIRPLVGGVKTQGLHGHNGVDLGGLPIGTPIMAAASGIVIVARDEGYNGGYGRYVVISHDNATQTVYGHMSSVIVTTGMQVNQGQVIGYLGNTGHSTGPHLHFEVRGAKNPGVDGSWAQSSLASR